MTGNNVIEKTTSLCIVTKPLQYVNVLNIPNLDKSNSDLIIEKTFNTNDLYKWLLDKNEWRNITLVENYSTALKIARKNEANYTNLYTFWDCGIVYGYIINKIDIPNIYIYDEGWGSYRDNLKPKYDLKRFISCVIQRNLDADLYIGAHPKVKGLFLYRPDVHRILIPQYKKQLEFKYDFETLLKKEDLSVFSNYAPSVDIRNKDVLLFLSSHIVSPKIFPILEKIDQEVVKIVKPHPHIGDKTNLTNHFDEIVKPSLMAEFVIYKIIEQCNSLLILHQNSTSVIYFHNNPKVTITNITPDFHYERISKLFNKN